MVIGGNVRSTEIERCAYPCLSSAPHHERATGGMRFPGPPCRDGDSEASPRAICSRMEMRHRPFMAMANNEARLHAPPCTPLPDGPIAIVVRAGKAGCSPRAKTVTFAAPRQRMGRSSAPQVAASDPRPSLVKETVVTWTSHYGFGLTLLRSRSVHLLNTSAFIYGECMHQINTLHHKTACSLKRIEVSINGRFGCSE